METRLLYSEAAKLAEELRNIVCSPPWLDAVLKQATDGLGNWIFTGYPPPGCEATGMRQCPDCRRIAPTNQYHSCLCYDCEAILHDIEPQLERFPEGADELLRRWWRRPVSVQEFAEGLVSGDDAWSLASVTMRLATAVAEPSAFEKSAIYLEDIGEDATNRPFAPSRRQIEDSIRYHLGQAKSEVLFFDPIPRSSLSSLPGDVASEIRAIVSEADRSVTASARSLLRVLREACKPLENHSVVRRHGCIILRCSGRPLCLLRFQRNRPRKASGQAIGCSFVLLPESEPALRKEITYALEHQVVMPRARRLARPRPSFRVRKPESVGGW